MKDLNELWCKIEKHSPQRSQWINDLDKSIQKIEQNRASLVRIYLISCSCISEINEQYFVIHVEI